MLASFAPTGLAQNTPAGGPIDRHALVSRHDIVIRQIDPNGAFGRGKR